MINDEVKKQAVNRLKRIEGQVKGLMKMVEDEKYCIDIINQANAVRRALESVTLLVMKRHIESCVSESIKKDGGRESIEELISSIDHYIK